ncbi:MAG: hypothetical protein JNL25_06065 [Rhodospirillaceae bacterium]|nr:hypothetical protein [Rhodospirillaceae bacterium]
MRAHSTRSSQLAVSMLLVSLMLAGCAQPATTSSAELASLTPPDPAPDTASMTKQPAVPAPFGGRWFVSAVYPAGGRAAAKGDPHIGVSLVITPTEASDVNGQRCVTPDFHTDRSGPEAGTLGNVALDSLERLRVDCKGSMFATFLLLPPRKLDAAAADAEAPHALLAARPEAHYLLERAEQVLLRQASLRAVPAMEDAAAPTPPAAKPGTMTPPQPIAETTPVPAPSPSPSAQPTLLAPLILAPEPPVAATPTENVTAPAPAPTAAVSGTLPAAGSAIHLASYAGISAAKRGWKILLGEFDVLDPMSPLYVNFDVPGKGPVVRLYATGGDRAQLEGACAALKARAAYCQISR